MQQFTTLPSELVNQKYCDAPPVLDQILMKAQDFIVIKQFHPLHKQIFYVGSNALNCKFDPIIAIILEMYVA